MSNLLKLQKHITSNASNTVITFKHQGVLDVEDNGNGVSRSCYQEIKLDEKNALRLAAFHNIVAKLVESDSGWLVNGDEETDGLLTAKDEHYNLFAIRHFFKNGSLGEVRVKATVNAFEKTVTDIFVSFNCREISDINNKWILLEEAVHNPTDVIETIDLMLKEALDASYGTYELINLNEMPIDIRIIQQMTMQNAENIKVVGFDEYFTMTLSYDFQANGFTQYARQHLDIKSYLKTAKSAWQNFLQ